MRSVSQAGDEMASCEYPYCVPMDHAAHCTHAAYRHHASMCNTSLTDQPLKCLQDKNPNNRQKAEEQFKIVSEAYDVSGWRALCSRHTCRCASVFRRHRCDVVHVSGEGHAAEQATAAAAC